MSHISSKFRNKIKSNYQESFQLLCEHPATIDIYDLSSEINADQMIMNCLNFKQKYPRSMHEYMKKQTNIRGWHSDYWTFVIADFLNPLIDCMKLKIVKSLKADYTVDIEDMWINIYDGQDYALRHNHSEVGYSAVYYPQVGNNPTPIVFDNNSSTNLQSIKIQPQKNMLLVFPGFLFHSVPELEENEHRISIAGNFSCISTAKFSADPLKYQI